MRSLARLTIARPSAELWRIVAPFGDIDSWHPLIDSCVLEQGDGGIGTVRRLTTTDGASVVERLVHYDDEARTFAYEFVASPFGVRDYRAVLAVNRGEHADESMVEWWTDFIPDDESTDWQSFFADQVFRPGLDALAAARPPAR